MEIQIVLTGPEGCGKSTFAQQLQSIYEHRSLVWPAAKILKLPPTTGKELFSISLASGRVVRRAPVKEWVRSQVGLSRQGERLFRRWENTPLNEFEPAFANANESALAQLDQSGSATLESCRCDRYADPLSSRSTKNNANSNKTTQCTGTTKPPYNPPITPSITMAAVTSLQRNNNTDTTHRAGHSGNTNTFSVVDHTMDSSEFITYSLAGPGDSGGAMPTESDTAKNEIVTRKDFKTRQRIENERRQGEVPSRGTAGGADDQVVTDNIDRVRKVFPDSDENFKQCSIEIQEVGGRMMSVLPKFLSKLNLSGCDPNKSSGDVSEGIFIFMIDLTNPSQIASSSIELSYIRQTFLRQNKTSRRRWCIIANKCMSLLASGAAPVSHSRAAGGSVLSASGLDASEIALIRHRIKQLMLIPDHPDFSSESDDDFDVSVTQSAKCSDHARPKRQTTIVSSDGCQQRPAVVEDFVPPIFIADTWTGTGFGDFLAWLEDR